MKRGEQRQLLRRVLQSYTKTVDLEGILRLSGHEAEADEVARQADALRGEVDRLRREMWRRWHGGAARLEDALRDQNTRLQRAIREIERDARRGADVARTLGVVEEILTIARAIGGA